MELVIKDIKNTTQKKYMDYGKNPGSPDNDFLFMYSVARWGRCRSLWYKHHPLSAKLQNNLNIEKAKWKFDFFFFVKKWPEKQVGKWRYWIGGSALLL